MMPQREKRLERLVDANPRWLDSNGLGGVLKNTYVCFECPIHGNGCEILVPAKPNTPNGWDVSGDSFENLTLAPSIKSMGGEKGCEWHGFVRNGRFEHCSDSK